MIQHEFLMKITSSSELSKTGNPLDREQFRGILNTAL
jgi:hypothetical protein